MGDVCVPSRSLERRLPWVSWAESQASGVLRPSQETLALCPEDGSGLSRCFGAHPPCKSLRGSPSGVKGWGQACEVTLRGQDEADPSSSRVITGGACGHPASGRVPAGASVGRVPPPPYRSISIAPP